MTVISVLRLGENRGIIAGDERATFGGSRSYDVARKIIKVGNGEGQDVYAGLIGDSMFLHDVLRTADLASHSYSGIVDALGHEFNKSYATRVFDGAASEQHTTWRRYLSGKLDDGVKHEIERTVERNKRQLNAEFLVVGFDPGKNKYLISSIDQAEIRYFNEFVVSGSGMDQAQPVISGYLSRMNPDARENISSADGTRILLEATRHAWHNVGVGGRTQIVLTEAGNTREFPYRDSNLLQNLLGLEDQGILDRKYVNARFRDVVEEGVETRAVLEKIAKKIPPEKVLELYLTESLHS